MNHAFDGIRALLAALAAFAPSLAALGCGPQGAPSYYGDAKPVLDAKCVGCHHDGGIAPFALDEYEGASGRARMIADAVVSRRMPPWPPDPGCNSYLYDRSLDEAQIATLAAWSEAGAPEGDASDPGAALGPAPEATLSRVDRSLALDAPYTPAAVEDEYRCFVLDWPESTTRFVAGLRARPGEGRIVHHVIVYAADPAQVAAVDALDAADPAPGYACFGGAGFPQPHWLGSWVPGSESRDYPAGTGVRVEPGSKLVVQIHYNMSGSPPLPDRTAIEVRLEDGVAKEARIQPFANPGWLGTQAMRIPAGNPDASYAFALDPTPIVSGSQPFTVYANALHMHALGKSARLHIERANGGDTCLLDIPEWDFHWQRMYFLAEPTVLAPGDRMALECRWDNSAENQPAVDGVQAPPHDVYWGEGTADEMCLGTFYLTVP